MSNVATIMYAAKMETIAEITYLESQKRKYSTKSRVEN